METTEHSEEEKIIDFESFETFNKKKKSRIFLKKPDGQSIPMDHIWKCVCGHRNAFLEQEYQHCAKCGMVLRIQDNHNKDIRYWTMVRVGHFGIKNEVPAKDQS